MEKLKIVAIVGSLRKDSFNRQLALAAKAVVGSRADFEILDYSDVPLLNQDIEYPAPAPVKRVREAVKAADGVWIFTPEYNHFFPGVLKNLLDWLSRPISDAQPRVVIGKPTAISGITPGLSGTALAQDHLVTMISFLNMKIMNQPRLVIPHATEQLNSEGKLELKRSAADLEKQAGAFLAFIEREQQK